MHTTFYSINKQIPLLYCIAHAAMYRDFATSPLASPPVKESPGQRKSPAYKAMVRQLQPMKQRVGYLQQQVEVYYCFCHLFLCMFLLFFAVLCIFE